MNNFKSPCGNFKSPVQGKCDKKSASSAENITENIKELKEKLAGVNHQINLHKAEGCSEEELKLHIDKLHEYNEIKDVGQMILGRIANLEGVRCQDLYEKYDLDLVD